MVTFHPLDYAMSHIIRMFGKPDITLKKFKDGTSVWSYKSITNVATGIIVMKGKTTGTQLNIFLDGTDTVIDYEIIEMKEYLFSPG